MEKSTLIKLAAVVAVIIILALAWLFFSQKNTVTSRPSGVKNSAQSSGKSITSFAFSELGANASEVVDNANHTITVVVPHGTNITSLTPAISTANFSTISPNSGVAQNFKNPVVYTVTAQDGSTQSYTITVKVATAKGFGGS